MKLYATVTSERASKGQGGQWLDILIQNEKKRTIGKIFLKPISDSWDGYYLYAEFHKGLNRIKTYQEFCRLEPKGNNQKGEKCFSCNQTPDILGRCKCCNKDAF